MSERMSNWEEVEEEVAEEKDEEEEEEEEEKQVVELSGRGGGSGCRNVSLAAKGVTRKAPRFAWESETILALTCPTLRRCN